MKIAMFIPYFTSDRQSLPNCFEYWQRSAAANVSIDFFIPTNVEKKYANYKNIHFVYMSSDDFFRKVESVTGFPVLHDCYKIGEFRPLCALLFPDLIKRYDFWGYSELDLIFGDIQKYIGAYIEKGADVIGRLGHFRLIRNVQRLNKLPLQTLAGGYLNIKDAYQTPICTHFDEVQGMGVRYYKTGQMVYPLDEYIADIDQKFSFFAILNKKGRWYFRWENGTLTGYSNHGVKEEFLYVHFQKRRLKPEEDFPSDNLFFMYPQKISKQLPKMWEVITPTLWYTLRNRLNYRKRRRDDEAKAGNDVMDSIRFTAEFCREHGLFHTNSPDR